MDNNTIQGIDLSQYKKETLDNLKSSGKLYTAQWLARIATKDGKPIWLKDASNAIDTWLEEEHRSNEELQSQNKLLIKANAELQFSLQCVACDKNDLENNTTVLQCQNEALRKDLAGFLEENKRLLAERGEIMEGLQLLLQDSEHYGHFNISTSLTAMTMAKAVILKNGGKVLGINSKELTKSEAQLKALSSH